MSFNTGIFGISVYRTSLMATAITSTSFFSRSPEGFSHTEEGSRAHFRAKETEIKRYYTKTTRPNYRHNSEIGFE